MRKSKGNASKPKKSFKDFVKCCLWQSSMVVDQWEAVELDRNQWNKLVPDGIEFFEYKRVQYTAFKR